MRALLTLGLLLGCTQSGGGKAPDDTSAGTGTSPDDTAKTDDSGSGDDTGWSCSDGTAHVEVGTGEDGFEALTTGDSVIMVHGPQGGWHVLGSVRIWNMEPIVDIHFVVTSLSHEAVVADNTYRVATVIDTQCTDLFWGMYGYLDVHELAEGDLDTPPELLAYEDLEIRMTVTDRSGSAAEAAMVVKAVPDPADVEDDAPAKH